MHISGACYWPLIKPSVYLTMYVFIHRNTWPDSLAAYRDMCDNRDDVALFSTEFNNPRTNHTESVYLS